MGTYVLYMSDLYNLKAKRQMLLSPFYGAVSFFFFLQSCDTPSCSNACICSVSLTWNLFQKMGLVKTEFVNPEISVTLG